MMMALLILITLICLLLPAYVYMGYPLMLWLLTRGKPPITHQREEIQPSVTLIVSCYNEAGVIREKLQNCLAIDYPRNALDIVVVSDGSDDGTDEIVQEYADKNIRLVRQEGRLGKTMGLNLAMETIESDVVVFSDANAMYAPDAIKMLVRSFADEQVGYVVGAALYTDGSEGASASNENLYWRYELAIKSMESQLHSVVGGDGAIYAIRRSLWEPLQQRDINDFENPLQIISKGYRGIFDPEARCYEETAGNFDKEIARKERIVNRSIRGLMRVKEVMNPSRTGVFAWEVISHKLLRWLIPMFVVIGVLGSTFLISLGYHVFQPVGLGAFLLVLLAAIGYRAEDQNRLPVYLSIPYYFVMVNAYALKGIIKALRGETQVTWNSARAAQSAQDNAGLDITGVSFVAVLLYLAISIIIGLVFF